MNMLFDDDGSSEEAMRIVMQDELLEATAVVVPSGVGTRPGAIGRSSWAMDLRSAVMLGEGDADAAAGNGRRYR